MERLFKKQIENYVLLPKIIILKVCKHVKKKSDRCYFIISFKKDSA